MRTALAAAAIILGVAGAHSAELPAPRSVEIGKRALQQSSDALTIAQTAAVDLSLPGNVELRPTRERRSLTGRHVDLGLWIEGRPVIGAGIAVSLGSETPTLALTRIPALALRPVENAVEADPTLAIASATGALRVLTRERVWLDVEDCLIDADRWVVEQDALRAWHVFTRRSSGEVLAVTPLFFNASRLARVFPSNPVQHLSDPSLRDRNDSATAVPAAAYSIEPLQGLDESGHLSGDRVTIIDVSAPADAVLTWDDDLTAVDRSDSRFEGANAYYLIDSAQRYLESLGYAGPHRIINRSLEVDPRAFGGADNSFYVARVPGEGFLAYGTGGTDDAEDADIVHHELGHAIQDAISPGTFGGASASQARALGEGFSDYWAFSSGYADSLASGSDPFCIAEWDARCAGSAECAYPAGTECLRRVDSTATMSSYQSSNGPGVEHTNGQIWSSALRRIFLSLTDSLGTSEGRRRSDTLALEGHFGVPPSPTFATIARRMLQADATLYAGTSRGALCAAFTQSRILTTTECAGANISALFPSGEQREIPDNDPAGVTLQRTVTDTRTIERVFVRVEIAHPQRGDLRLVLIAPDGTPAQLLETSFADVSEGLSVTFGLDAAAAESLDVFRGRSAAGVWSLRVIDARPRDAGRVLSWAIGFQFNEDSRPSKRSGSTLAHLPVATVARGATGEWFQSDLALTAGENGAGVELWLGASNLAGTMRPLSTSISLEPRSTVLMTDLVRTLFGTGGGGAIDVRLLEGSAQVTSWITSTHPRGTLRQEIPPSEPTFQGRSVVIPYLSSEPPLRANIGLAETTGAPVSITVRVFATTGELRFEQSFLLPDAWEHRQFPLVPRLEGWALVSVDEGAGGIAAYVSVVDAESGDPSLIVGQPATTQTHRVPVVSNTGASGSEWRTVLHLSAPDGADVTLTLRDARGALVSQRRAGIPPLQSITIADVVDSGSRPFLGTLEVSSDAPFAAATRILNLRSVGRSGQLLESAFSRERLTLAPYLVDDRFRTNVLLWNDRNGPANARVTTIAADGEVLRQDELSLLPFELRLLQVDASGSSLGRIDIDASAPLAAWLSIVDNRSGDAVTVRAARTP